MITTDSIVPMSMYKYVAVTIVYDIINSIKVRKRTPLNTKYFKTPTLMTSSGMKTLFVRYDLISNLKKGRVLDIRFGDIIFT